MGNGMVFRAPGRKAACLLASLVIFAPGIGRASLTLDFSQGFANASATLNFNNSARIVGTRARITDGGALEVGSVWSKNQVDIRKFSCAFDFQLSAAGNDLEAGFTFTLQRAGNTVSGYPYESLGFTPTSPSLALKFDTWGETGSHIVSSTGLYANGKYPSDDPPDSIDMAPSGINLHSGHLFHVSLSYNGTTLTETITDSQTAASFTHSYPIDLPATIGGIHAYAGFTGSTGGVTTSNLQEIVNWTYSVTPSAYDVDFTAFPENLQLYPRDRLTNKARIQVAGSELMGGYSQAVVRVYLNGIQTGPDRVQTLTYTAGKAPFSFSGSISAQLAQYDVELLLRNGAGDVSVRRSSGVLAGDVFIVQGQSNATALEYLGSADGYISPFVHTFGMSSSIPLAASSFASWVVANGDGTTDVPGGVGQWGLVMGNVLMATNNIPVAILNGGQGGQPIAFFQRNDANPTDPLTNYGDFLARLRAAGLSTAIRALFYYQGESDFGAADVYEAGFDALHADWLTDYPSLERIYVFQLREGYFDPNHQEVARFDVDLRNRQRLFADQFANLSVFSTNGYDGHNGLHYNFAKGYEDIGINTARAVERDLYGGQNLPSLDPPNPAFAVLAVGNHRQLRVRLRNSSDVVTFQPGAEVDFQVNGVSVAVQSGNATNGVLQLQLSGDASAATTLLYTGHRGDGGILVTGKWVANANGLGLLSFIEPILIDNTAPVINLLGPNPQILRVGDTYTDPGATASDNLDVDLTSRVVKGGDPVVTTVPATFTVTYNVTDTAGNVAPQVTRTVQVRRRFNPR